MNTHRIDAAQCLDYYPADDIEAMLADPLRTEAAKQMLRDAVASANGPLIERLLRPLSGLPSPETDPELFGEGGEQGRDVVSVCDTDHGPAGSALDEVQGVRASLDVLGER